MLFGTVLLWALNITVTKYMFRHGWLPLAYGTIRYFAAISLFWGFTYWRERSFRIERRDLRLVLLAATMIFLNQLCFVYALKLTHASTVALLLGTTPIFIGLISLALGIEHLPHPFWIGAAVTFVGIALIALANGGVGSSLNGTLIAIGMAFTWACYTIAIAPLMRRYGGRSGSPSPTPWSARCSSPTSSGSRRSPASARRVPRSSPTCNRSSRSSSR